MKNIFNFKLFLDGMRQLRTIGLVSLVIFCLEAVFSVIGINISAQTAASFAYDMPDYDVFAAYSMTYNLYQLHPILLAAFFVLIPIMVLYMFGFLNKRNASDFYHSSPVRRETLAFSLLASIMAWVLITVLSSTVLVCVLTVFTKFVSINMYSVFVSLLATIAACLCVLGAGFFAMSVTGTYFSNFAVSVMLLTAPRLILTTYVALVSELNPLLLFSFDNGILDYRLNIVVGSILSAMFSTDALYPLEHFVPILYTLIISVFYFAAGFYAFMNRKSEIATMPAANSKLQLLFRLIPSCLICLIPLTLISYDVLYDNSGLDSMMIFFIVLLYVIAVIVYFLYELISTKKISSLLKSFKTLWILAAFNIVFFVSIIIGYHVTLNDVPDKGNVNSVMISHNQINSYGYFTNTSSQVKFTDKALIDFCVDTLQECVDEVKNKSEADGHRYFGSTVVTFNTKGRTIKRRISFENSLQYEQFTGLLNNCDEYVNVYKNIPEYSSLSNIDFYIEGGSASASNFLTSDDIREIYDSLRSEQMTLTFENAYANAVNYSLLKCFGGFYGNYTVKNSNYQYAIYITDLTPKTALMMMEKINANSQNKFSLQELSNIDTIHFTFIKDALFDRNVLETLDSSSLSTSADYTASAEYIPATESAERVDSTSLSVTSKELRSSFINELSKTYNTKITSLDAPIVFISYSVKGADGEQGKYARYFYATDELVNLYNEHFAGL